MKLSVFNDLDQLQTTPISYTSFNHVAGGTTVTVKNSAGIITQYAQQIGRTGEELAEIVLVSGNPSTFNFNTSGTLKFDHPIETPIYQIHYDKIIFKRSTAGTSGTATALSNGTVSITPDSYYTDFEDTSGALTYAYKTQYYNSLTGDVSEDSGWFIPGGPSFYSLQKMRERTKAKLYSTGFIKDNSDIDDWLNEWLEEMNTAAIRVNQDYLLGTTEVTFGTAGYGTISNSDYMYTRKLEICTGGTTFTPSTHMPVNRYSDSDIFDANNPYHTWIGDTIFRVLPHGLAGTARITYSKGEPILSSETDELPHPMRKYTRSFTYYAQSMAYDLDEKADLARNKYEQAQKVKSDFIAEIAPRDNTGPKFINFVDGLSGFQEDVW